MAESYRGLTIRIGGDTSKLTDALKRANSAISGTQNTLKKLDQALRLDPSSIDAARLQVGALAENAASTATKLAGLRSAMQQIGENMEFGKPIKELAENTKDAFTQAEIARAKYASICEEIAKIDHQVSKLSQAQADLAGADLYEKLTNSFAGAKTDVEGLVDEIGKIPAGIQPSTEKTREFANSVSEIVKKYQKASDELDVFNQKMDNATTKREQTSASNGIIRTVKEMAQLGEEYQNLVLKFSNLKGTVFSFANSNNSVDELRKALVSLPEAIKPTSTEIGNIISRADELKDHFHVARSELEKFTQIAQFKDLQAEVEKAAASIQKMARAMADMKTPSEVMRGMYDITESVKVLDEAVNKYKALGDSMASASKLNPDDTTAATAAMNAYGQAVMANNEKIQSLEMTLDGLRDKWQEASSSADFGKTAERQLMDANAAVEKSSTVIAEYEGKLADARIKMAQFGITAKDALEILASDEWDDNDKSKAQEYLDLAKNAGDYVNVLKLLNTEHDELAKQQEDSRLRKEWEENNALLDQAKAKTTELTVSAEKLGKTDATPKFDKSFGSQLKATLDQLLKGTDLGALGDEIKQLDTDFESAKNRVKALDDALKFDPKNTELLAKRAAALAEAEQLASAEQKKLNQAISQLEPAVLERASMSAEEFAVRLANDQRAAKESTAAVQGYENVISELEGEIEKIEGKDGVLSAEDKQNVDSLRQSIDKLNESLAVMRTRANVDLENLDFDQRAVDAQRMTDRVQELDNAVDELSQKKATPKIDQAAFMQAIQMIGNAARQMGQHVVESANEIDAAFRDMRKTVNGTEMEFTALRDAAIAYSQTHVTSADTMLEMQALGGQLGVMVEDLEQFGQMASNLDIATNIDAESIALQLGQIGNVLGLDIDGMQGFSDALVRLGNNMPTQESAIMNVAQRFGAVATTAKFSGEEILAWSAAIASTGQRSEAAATAIGNTVSGIEQALASGGDDLNQFARIAGLSADEFAAKWKSSPTEALKLFIQGLHTLTESDESAVAALENMGITGVRQQQTLLGLSQTIDNLDSALAMSTDAWNGVADQWGQADDAAVEAQKKSEGFSGALAILQNNAQNLGAVLGESLVEPMKWGAEVLKLLTDAIKAVPGPIVAVVEALGAGAIAFGTVGSVVKTLTEGITLFYENLATSNSISQFATSLMNMTNSASGAAAATEAVGTAAGGPLVLGITAAIGVIALIAAAVQDYEQKQELARQATEGLVEATDAAKTSYDEYISGAQNATMSLHELRDAMEEATEAQARLAGEMEQDWSDIGTSEATVDMLIAKMEELTSKQSLSAEEQGELYAAVQSFNAITGQSVSVIDEQRGKLDKSINTIHGYADAWKESSESTQHLKDYGDMVKQLADEQKLLEEAEKRLAYTQGDMNNTMVAGSQGFVDLRDTASSTAGVYSSLSSEIQQHRSNISSLEKALKEAASGMTGVDKQVAAVEAELARYGDSLSNYGELTDAELRQVIAAFSNTADSSVSAIERIRNALAGIKEARNEATNAAADAIVSSGPVTSGGADYDKDFYDQQKKAFDQQIKELQRQFDAVYKAQQKAYDAEYKALQKQLDKVYKERQKAYEKEYNELKKKLDKEYDARKKQYDKEYKALKDQLDAAYNARKKAYDKQEDALKDQLDAEYDALKKALDAQYKARKKELDAEYDQLKKQLDKAYNERKKQLDKEYKALQKQNDKILKQLKDAQAKEVKAFKDATKARIAAIKAEYEERKKLLEGEDGRAEIDARIKALEDETKAEQAQAKAREQAEKIAELQSAVDAAKTRRKRADAEKALNDYLAELAQERREEEREAEIERLEEQKDAIKDLTDAKKEALDEQRDAEIAAYEAQREIELEQLQAQQEMEYEALKERLDAQEEALKEHHDAILEALKAEQQAELDAMAEQHDAILQALSDAHQAQLDALKDANDAQLQALKDRHQAQLDALRDAQDRQLQTLKDRQDAQLQALKDKQSEQLQALKDKQSEQLEALKESQSEQLEALKDSQQEALQALKDSQQDQLDAEKEHQQAILDEIKNGLRDRNGIVESANRELENEQERSQREIENDAREIAWSLDRETRSLADSVIGNGTAMMFGYADAIAKSDAPSNARYVADSVIHELDDVQRFTRNSGLNAGYNFADGIRESAWDVMNAAANIAADVASYLHFSVPEKGPLSDEDKWGGDMIQNLIDGMRTKQGALIEQVRRMSDAMEQAFDPTLTVDAAFDAIDTMRQAGGPLAYQSKQPPQSPGIELNVNINLSGVTIRDESDIDMLAQRVSQSMAAATARELAGRLG